MDGLRVFDTDDHEAAHVVKQIRSVLKRSPDPVIEERHIAAILDEARRTPRAPVTTRRRRAPLMVRLGAVAGGLALLTGGLALAGVDLPGLPDQSTGKPSKPTPVAQNSSSDESPERSSETAERVQSTIAASLPLLRSGDISGCEFAALVSASAREGVLDSSCGAPGEEKTQAGETSERVQMTIEANLPLMRTGEISGCEFGALVSAAARDVVADSSHCNTSEDDEELTGKDKAEKAPKDKAEKAPKDKAGGNSSDDPSGDSGDDEDVEGSDESADDDEADKDEADSGDKANPKDDDVEESESDESADDAEADKDKAEKDSGGKAGGDSSTPGTEKADKASTGKAEPGGKSKE
jgi:hypothetical protein